MRRTHPTILYPTLFDDKDKSTRLSRAFYEILTVNIFQKTRYISYLFTGTRCS